MIFEAPPLAEPQRRALLRIEELRDELRFRLHSPRRWTGSLRRISMARVVRGSNAIEGYTASLGTIVAEAAHGLPPRADGENVQAVRGYRDAMTMILQLADDPAFEYHPMLLRSLQFMMTSYDLDRRPGRWRAGQVFVTDEVTGDQVYEGPDIELVPELTDELVDTLNQASSDQPTLVRAAMAHLNLVMIHPFKDGNGRMARALQTLVLARDGLLSPVFCSVEEYLGEHTERYYEVLAEVGGGRWSPNRDVTPWIDFSLLAHFRQARLHVLRIRGTELLWDRLESVCDEDGLARRVVAALYDAASGVEVSNATYRAAHETPMSDQVASRDLKLLVERGWLLGRGENRGRTYVHSNKLGELADQARRDTAPLVDSDPFRP